MVGNVEERMQENNTKSSGSSEDHQGESSKIQEQERDGFSETQGDRCEWCCKKQGDQRDGMTDQ